MFFLISNCLFYDKRTIKDFIEMGFKLNLIIAKQIFINSF
ncbi:hypothetical protein UNSW1_61 [Campylobacter concisus UNSW1]|uniref:Copper oxidase n=1 Tax=Campylobacter concisus TaxID=199 RepID=A0A1Y5NB11_9BACT|nr:hypothetical protein UNSW1_61 [Campylobacter concisus UNSW1]OUT16613.1 copper oxidase [Campylobacter concisus]